MKNYQELKKEIIRHNTLYYDLSKPELADADYDKLYNELEAIEVAQGWCDSDSPTLKVGGAKGKVRHPYTLYSLRKVYDPEEVDPSYKVKTPKLDGSNLNLTYINGKLELALTRGDGEFGEDVRHLMKYCAGVPQSLNNAPEIVVVTGECVTDNEGVENFRNYVSGALGLKDAEEFKTRNIRYIVHDWLGVEMNYTNRMDIIKNLGFYTVMNTELCDKYPQDGLVFRLDDWRESKRLGYTSKYPRFAVALKEREALTAQTALQSVEWVVGRTGTVNPVGIVTPVILDGATVSRVTLHNLEFIENAKLGLGDVIEIERAGGVIPKFIRVLEHSSLDQKIDIKHAERAIGTSVKRVGPKIFVADSSQVGTRKLLEHFVKTLEIKGLGPSSITKLGLEHPLDLYKSQPWDALGANGAKVQAEIERSKTKPYSTVLAALGIPGVGKSSARLIVRHIPMFHRLRDVENTHIKGIGPKTVESILVWLEVNEAWVQELPLSLEETIEYQSVGSAMMPAEQKKVCVTGKLDMTRNEIKEHLESLGYVVSSSVTKDCYALITDGEISSSKVKKAESIGTVKIINYFEKKAEVLNGNF